MSPLPEGLPPLKDVGSRGSRLRFDEPIPKRCDWNHREDLKERWGKEPHFWVSFESFFETRLARVSEPYAHRPRNPLADKIPHWAVCNCCYLVNPEIAICGAYVPNAIGGSDCGRRARVFRPFDKWGKPLADGRVMPYCGVHDPVVRAAKRAERDEADRLARAAAAEEWERRRLKSEAHAEIIAQAREVLAWFDESGIHNDDEWAGTIERKLRPAMEVYDADG